jgi:7-cyano-7-deazaguanine synthase
MTPHATEPNNGAPKAVVLLSGGLDSATCLAIAKDQGFDPFALTLRYGQRHQAEIAAAEGIARAEGAAGHDVMDIDLARFGGSALTGNADVPKGRSENDMADGIPVTYVPARNTVFLALALARAETLAAKDIFIGVNALDYSGYPDCRPEFVAAFESLANLATKAGVEAADTGGPKITIHAPLIDLSKSEIITRGMALGVDYARTLSCYAPPVSEEVVSGGPGSGEGGVRHCGRCDACLLRRKGFAGAGVSDPTDYAA